MKDAALWYIFLRQWPYRWLSDIRFWLKAPESLGFLVYATEPVPPFRKGGLGGDFRNLTTGPAVCCAVHPPSPPFQRRERLWLRCPALGMTSAFSEFRGISQSQFSIPEAVVQITWPFSGIHQKRRFQRERTPRAENAR